MNGWKITGIIATIIIVLSIPLYLLKTVYLYPQLGNNRSVEKYDFTGSLKCADCHRKEYDKWLDSHHDHAMEVVSEKTVLGDFNNALFTNHDVTSKFFRKAEKFFVHTQGPGGEMKDFEITHTFGWYPLQQYLVPFPGGRLQCLPIAWDTQKNEWYDLNRDKMIDPGDWLYWTNAGQNWNGMCAECHSTNLKKNYDLNTDTYHTIWTDIDVGCEACHGPGSKHVEWAETPEMGRPRVNNYNLAVRTSETTSGELVNLCAPCHSRRAILGDYTHSETDLLDSLLPTLITSELYFPDGQILEEVYVYGSFTQSKMYNRDVKCSDCHDSHSAKLLMEGNDLCLQCHRAGEYNTAEHHFHKSKGEKGEPIKSGDGKILFNVGTGSECVQCHMPGRNYMVIDNRSDHSFRIPRPDLSEKINVPNACNMCHINETNQWSDEWITRWYGPGRRSHYGTIIKDGQSRDPYACNDIISLAADSLYPVNVRTTALSLLMNCPGSEASRLFEISLMDDEALVRHTSVELLNIEDDKEKAILIAPLLYDSVKAVRIQAASKLAGEPSKYLDADQKRVFNKVLDEFISSMEYSADFSFGRHNLGNLYRALGRDEEAISNYVAAIRIDNLFYPAKVNLAMLYNDSGDKDKAEELFREVVREHPSLHEISYSLALLLAEKNKYGEAELFMGNAASNMPGAARVQYNYGLLLQYLKKDRKAEAALQKALDLEPENMDFLYALFDFYFQRSKFNQAKTIAETMVRIHPELPAVRELLDIVTKLIESNE
ncbi:tetratricopeptide repeat protein [Thermodesulfobacteriota bacterium]